MKGLLDVAMKGYPDRLEGLYAGPVNMAVRMMHRMLSPLIPARLAEKIHLIDNVVARMADKVAPAKYFTEPHPSFVVEGEGPAAQGGEGIAAQGGESSATTSCTRHERFFSLAKMEAIQREELHVLTTAS